MRIIWGLILIITIKVANADQCQNTHLYEKKYNIPSGVLFSISMVESSITYQQKALAWPWTLNVRGKPFYLADKNAMIKAIELLLKNKVENFDFGCMQINYFYHKEHFTDIKKLTDPNYHMDYAAKLLVKHYNDTKSWPKAVSFYHSQKPDKGKNYLNKVIEVKKQYNAKNKEATTKNINRLKQGKMIIYMRDRKKINHLK